MSDDCRAKISLNSIIDRPYDVHDPMDTVHSCFLSENRNMHETEFYKMKIKYGKNNNKIISYHLEAFGCELHTFEIIIIKKTI